jgi:purine-binding chemotaxis protein CheW
MAGAIEPLPGAPAPVRGVANLRGEVVPVLDSARLLGVADTTFDHLVVVESERGICALTALGRPRTAALDTPAGPAELGPSTGRFSVGNDVVTYVDLAALLAPGRIGDAL